MIPEYIHDFLSLIRHGSKVNSYKLVWAKAIVEISTEQPGIESIRLEEIAKKVFKYYWNQTIYFDLIQGNNPNKRPEFVEEVRSQIELYYDSTADRKPIHFEKIESEIDLNLKKMTNILKKDVSWRFPIINKRSAPVYQYSRNSNEINNVNSILLAEYSDILFESINYKWTQILESFNNAPRIAKKVRILDFKEIKRKSLRPFKQYIEIENENKHCFLCDRTIEGLPSIDHVIPWSFIFSDDLWNLVYVHPSCNSSKSNIVPSSKMIKRLEERNIRMLNLLKLNSILGTKKHYKELELAIERDYVRKFWIHCKN